MAKRTIAILLPLALCACASPRDTVPYPYAALIDTTKRCADLRGRYLLPVQPEPATNKDARGILAMLCGAAGRPTEAWTSYFKETRSPRTLSLQIDTTDGEELSLKLSDAATGSVVDAWSLSARQGQYRCGHGGITFPEISHKGQSGEGIDVSRVSSACELSLASDGALVGHWKSTVHGSAWLLPYSQHNEDWYRAERQP